MTIPQLSEEQRREARLAAAAARRARADLKERLADGRVTLAEALAEAQADEVLAAIPVVALLKSLPRVGDKKAGEIMERVQIASNRRVRGLGHRQVAALVEEFA